MSLHDALNRLRLFRSSFEEGEICEETGLTTGDVDLILSVLEPAGQIECVTCGQYFDPADGAAAAHHDQEVHQPQGR